MPHVLNYTFWMKIYKNMGDTLNDFKQVIHEDYIALANDILHLKNTAVVHHHVLDEDGYSQAFFLYTYSVREYFKPSIIYF